VEAIASMNPDTFKAVVDQQMKKSIPNLSTCACGESPVIAAMTAARGLGANCGRIIRYANSGDSLIGSRNRVVGYGAIAFMKADDCNFDTTPEPGSNINELTDDHKKTLLAFARKSIRRYFETETIPLPLGFEKPLTNLQGAFVTLKKHGQLRGCIGHMAENMPLCHVVGAMALQAAFNDRRFSPLQHSELDDVEIEISVLTPSKEIKDYNDIVLGRDGVILKKNNRSAVFLPQVATEQGWDRTEMLGHLSRKAGLPEDAWKNDAVFYTFQAIVFGESEAK
jgi:AmmeMemoRadiSam system protein A